MENPIVQGPVSEPRILTKVRRCPAHMYRWIVLSTNWWKALVHWSPGPERSLPCWKDKKRCPGHALNLPIKELAWLHVYCHNLKEVCFLELPHHAAFELYRLLEVNPSLRGSQFDTRRNGGPNQRIMFDVKESWPLDKMAAFPVPADPFTTLKELWNMNEVHLKIRSANDLDTDLETA